MDHVVVHKEIDLLDAGYCVYAQPLECCLKPLVVCGGHLVHGLLFPTICSNDIVARHASQVPEQEVPFAPDSALTVHNDDDGDDPAYA